MAARGSLPIHALEQRHTGLTKAIADSYTEAARVCLDRHHRSPADFELDDAGGTTAATAAWEETDARTRAAWGNEIDATEAGAYACALGAVELVHGLVAVRRAETMTGADYYVAPRGHTADDLEGWVRLEVSGLDRGLEGEVRRRLRTKVDQALRGRSNLPARAVVVGFRARLIALSDTLA